MQRTSRSAFAVFLASLLVAGCTQSPASPSVAPSQPSESQPSGSQPSGEVDVVKLGTVAKPVSLDPLKAVGIASYNIMTLTSGQLYRLDQSGKATPDLVKTADVSADRLTWTMRLHDNIRYSDDTALTGADVVHAYERIKAAARTNKVLISTVTSVKATDAQTVVWTLSAPQDELPLFFASGYMPIYPRDRVDVKEFFDAAPVSAGPYVVENWTPNANATALIANTKYVHQPVPVRRVEFIFVPDPTTRSLQLSQGELDIVEDIPAIAAGLLPTAVTAKPNAIGGSTFLLFNFTKTSSPIADANVRKTIALALDRKAISDTAFQGVARPAYSIAVPGTSGAAAAAAAVPNLGQQDLTAAKEALAASAYPKGFDVTIQVPADRVGWLDSVLIIQQQLKPLGINLQVQAMDFTTSIANQTAGTYDLAFAGAGGFPYTNIGFYALILGKGNVIQSRTRCVDEQLQSLLTQASVAAAADATRLYAEVEKRNSEVNCVIPLSERVQIVAQRQDRVKGLLGFATSSQFMFVKTGN